jgi:hypothetical protein
MADNKVCEHKADVAVAEAFCNSQADALAESCTAATTCADDPTGSLTAFGGCDTLVTAYGCDTDLNTLNNAAPVGSLLKNICPVKCSTCPDANTDCSFTPGDRATCGTGCTYVAPVSKPQRAVVAMCVSVTSDATVLGDICAAVGVGETARILCDDVGYSAGTCDDVSQQAAAAFAT